MRQVDSNLVACRLELPSSMSGSGEGEGLFFGLDMVCGVCVVWVGNRPSYSFLGLRFWASALNAAKSLRGAVFGVVAGVGRGAELHHRR